MAQTQEGVVIEGEASEQHANPNVAEDKYEVSARKKGWAPETEWRGDPEDWVPAKEFIGRQKLFDRINDLKSTLKKEREESKKDFAVVSKQMAEIQEQAYQKALNELKAQRAVALEDQNASALDAIEEEIDETKQKLAEAKKQKQDAEKAPKQVQESEAFVSWKSENKWFESNSEAKEDAIAIGVGYAAKNPNKTEKEVYEYVTNKIRKMYPEEFKSEDTSKDDDEGEPQSKEKKVAAVETSQGPRTQGNKQVKKTQLTSADLSEKERDVMKTLIKRGALKEIAAKNKRSEQEEYLAQLAEARGVDKASSSK